MCGLGMWQGPAIRRWIVIAACFLTTACASSTSCWKRLPIPSEDALTPAADLARLRDGDPAHFRETAAQWVGQYGDLADRHRDLVRYVRELERLKHEAE